MTASADGQPCLTDGDSARELLLADTPDGAGSIQEVTTNAPRHPLVYVYLASGVAAVGGVLFGYDTGKCQDYKLNNNRITKLLIIINIFTMYKTHFCYPF